MNKQQIDAYIPKAYNALKDFGIAYLHRDVYKIKKTFRGYISSFGASIIMGSLCSAIAFNSQQNHAENEREKLMMAIYYLISGSDSIEGITNLSLLQFVINNKENETKIKEDIYNAAIAIKLAMNMYELTEEQK